LLILVLNRLFTPTLVGVLDPTCPLFYFLIFCSNLFYFSLPIFFPDSFFYALASSFFFSPVRPAACSRCSPLHARTRGPAHDPPLPPLLAMHARSHHVARVTPSQRAARCCAGPSSSRPLALAARALSPSIPAAINGETPVLPVTPPGGQLPSSSRPINQTPNRPSLRPHHPNTSPPLPHAATRRRRSPLPPTTHHRG
jgi:hypothetical protein